MYSVNQREIDSQPHTQKVISGRKGKSIPCVKCADEYIKMDSMGQNQLCRKANGKYSTIPPLLQIFTLVTHKSWIAELENLSQKVSISSKSSN